MPGGRQRGALLAVVLPHSASIERRPPANKALQQASRPPGWPRRVERYGKGTVLLSEGDAAHESWLVSALGLGLGTLMTLGAAALISETMGVADNPQGRKR